MTTDDTRTLPEDAAKLAAFIGEWAVAGSFVDATGDHAVTGRWRYAEVADGWGVRGDMETTIEGLAPLEECELIGMDAITGSIHLFSMNRLTIRDHVGRWEGPATLVTRWDGDGAVEVITIVFDNGDSMRAEVVETERGGLVVTTTLTFTRER